MDIRGRQLRSKALNSGHLTLSHVPFRTALHFVALRAHCRRDACAPSVTAPASCAAEERQSAGLNEGCRTVGSLSENLFCRDSLRRSCSTIRMLDPYRQDQHRLAQNRKARRNVALITPSTHQVSSALRLSFPRSHRHKQAELLPLWRL